MDTRPMPIGILVVAVAVVGYSYWDSQHNTVLKVPGVEIKRIEARTERMSEYAGPVSNGAGVERNFARRLNPVSVMHRATSGSHSAYH